MARTKQYIAVRLIVEFLQILMSNYQFYWHRSVIFGLIILISFSGAPASQRSAKRNTIPIGTEPHVCIEIETHATLSLFHSQHGGHTPANTESGLQCISLILDFMLLSIDT